ncbi:iron-containing alcohol dehydrogenase, partial [Xylella fastidiosa subsp. multiplex]|nr:iron-containing alcohol dehydrogenase [Xylella fastidiosa subsp. multiplex]
MNTMSIAPILLHQPRRLAVGAGTIAQVGAFAGKTASTLVIATPLTAKFVDRLQLQGPFTVFDAIPGEPDTATLNAAL